MSLDNEAVDDLPENCNGRQKNPRGIAKRQRNVRTLPERITLFLGHSDAFYLACTIGSEKHIKQLIFNRPRPPNRRQNQSAPRLLLRAFAYSGLYLGELPIVLRRLPPRRWGELLREDVLRALQTRAVAAVRNHGAKVDIQPYDLV